MSLTLYYHPLSSFCWKVLIALYENGTPFTLKPVNLGDPDERASLLKLWPIGKFPVLRDEARDRTVPESSIIIEYLDRHYPGHIKLVSDDPEVALQTRLRDAFSISTFTCRCRRSSATGFARSATRIHAAWKTPGRSFAAPMT